MDVACCVYEAAGAFSAERAVDAIVLIAGDADFLPAVKGVLRHRGPEADNSHRAKSYGAPMEEGEGDGDGASVQVRIPLYMYVYIHIYTHIYIYI